MSVWMCPSVCCVLDTEGVHLAQWQWVKYSSSSPAPLLSISLHRYNGEVGDMVVGRIIEVRRSQSSQEYPYFYSLCNYYLRSMVCMQINLPSTSCCVNYSSLVSRYSKSVGKWKHFLVWILSYFSPPSISLEVCWWVLLPWWPQGLVPGARVYLVSFSGPLVSCPDPPPALGTGKEPGNEAKAVQTCGSSLIFSYTQRRRSTQDELMMREYFQEGDLISVGNFSSQFLFLLV